MSNIKLDDHCEYKFVETLCLRSCVSVQSGSCVSVRLFFPNE
ncbi:unnamed protein product [Rhodiola kirilowii]